MKNRPLTQPLYQNLCCFNFYTVAPPTTLSDLLNDLPVPGRRNNSFQARLWPRYHEFRVKHVPRIWHTTIGTADPILMQRASLNLLIKIIILKKKGFAPTIVDPGKQEKPAKLSFEE